MTEHDLIARIIPQLATNKETILGAGDDCAALDCGIPDYLLLFKTDTVLEGKHFTSELLHSNDAYRIGRKAIARPLSDIASMGGVPISALVTLGLPQNFVPEEVDALYEGMNYWANEFGVSISGGETVASPVYFLTVSLVGKFPRSRTLPTRGAAQIGDALFCTGQLGGSLQSEKHLDFTPRIREGQWLVEHFPIHAMMDISDGLAGDLPHILRMSKCGAELLAEAIPIHSAAKKSSALDGRSAQEHALCDGEDFELLFSLPSPSAVPLLDAWKVRFPSLKLSCIGKIVNQDGITIRHRNALHVETLRGGGYDHFGTSV